MVRGPKAATRSAPWAWKPLGFIIAANLLFGVLLGGLPSISPASHGADATAIFGLTLVSQPVATPTTSREVLVLATIWPRAATSPSSGCSSCSSRCSLHSSPAGLPMDLFSNLALGFGVCLHLPEPDLLLHRLPAGAALIGVLPGIGPVATITMLLPPPTRAAAGMRAHHAGGIY